MKKPLIGAAGLLAGLVLLLGSAPAMAGVNVNVHVGVPAGVYVQPRPVYVTPQPVRVHAPRYAPPHRVHYQPPGHWRAKHGPRYLPAHPHGKKGPHHPHYRR